MSIATGIRVIQPTGILTGATTSSLLQEVQRCIENKSKLVLLDLRDVHFIDSSGLGTLVSIHAKMRLAGIRFCLCSLNDQAKGILDITDLDRTFEVFANRDEFYAVVL